MGNACDYQRPEFHQFKDGHEHEFIEVRLNRKTLRPARGNITPSGQFVGLKQEAKYKKCSEKGGEHHARSNHGQKEEDLIKRENGELQSPRFAQIGIRAPTHESGWVGDSREKREVHRSISPSEYGPAGHSGLGALLISENQSKSLILE